MDPCQAFGLCWIFFNQGILLELACTHLMHTNTELPTMNSIVHAFAAALTHACTWNFMVLSAEVGYGTLLVMTITLLLLFLHFRVHGFSSVMVTVFEVFVGLA